jgi:hypothetical protein
MLGSHVRGNQRAPPVQRHYKQQLVVNRVLRNASAALEWPSEPEFLDANVVRDHRLRITPANRRCVRGGAVHIAVTERSAFDVEFTAYTPATDEERHVIAAASSTMSVVDRPIADTVYEARYKVLVPQPTPPTAPPHSTVNAVETRRLAVLVAVVDDPQEKSSALRLHLDQRIDAPRTASFLLRVQNTSPRATLDDVLVHVDTDLATAFDSAVANSHGFAAGEWSAVDGGDLLPLLVCAVGSLAPGEERRICFAATLADDDTAHSGADIRLTAARAWSDTEPRALAPVGLSHQ